MQKIHDHREIRFGAVINRSDLIALQIFRFLHFFYPVQTPKRKKQTEYAEQKRNLSSFYTENPDQRGDQGCQKDIGCKPHGIFPQIPEKRKGYDSQKRPEDQVA